MAKYFERCAERYKGLRCLDLSAGCGLVGELLGATSTHVLEVQNYFLSPTGFSPIPYLQLVLSHTVLVH